MNDVARARREVGESAARARERGESSPSDERSDWFSLEVCNIDPSRQAAHLHLPLPLAFFAQPNAG